MILYTEYNESPKILDRASSFITAIHSPPFQSPSCLQTIRLFSSRPFDVTFVSSIHQHISGFSTSCLDLIHCSSENSLSSQCSQITCVCYTLVYYDENNSGLVIINASLFYIQVFKYWLEKSTQKFRLFSLSYHEKPYYFSFFGYTLPFFIEMFLNPLLSSYPFSFLYCHFRRYSLP